MVKRNSLFPGLGDCAWSAFTTWSFASDKGVDGFTEFLKGGWGINFIHDWQGRMYSIAVLVTMFYREYSCWQCSAHLSISFPLSVMMSPKSDFCGSVFIALGPTPPSVQTLLQSADSWIPQHRVSQSLVQRRAGRRGAMSYSNSNNFFIVY